MKSNIFKRIFLLYAVLMVLTIIVVELYITAAVKNYSIDILRKDLAVEISLISIRLSFKQEDADSLCREIKKDTGSRVTLIADDGRVIGDSDHDSAQMDNHLNRTEIAQAMLFDIGTAIRFSDTLNHDFLYVAKKIRQGDVSGFIRLAVPLREVGQTVNLLRIKIMLIVGVVLLLTWMVSFWQTNHLRRLLHQITEFSQSLSRGEIEKRLFLRNAGEFSEIADNLTAMSSKLQGMMAQSEEEKGRLNVIL
jgi:two-component system phosphate regulon sensor histidine kinase PhoR